MGQDLETLVQGFVREACEAVGEGIETVVLYGSAATGQYQPGRSDLNFLLVVRTIDLPLLDRLQKRMGGWAKRRIPAPLVVQPSFLRESTDAYPLEILGMMAGYRVLRGNDPFQGLSPEKEHVRIQAEREVKAKSLLLRRGYMESCGKHQRLLDCLIEGLPAIDAIFRGLLYVRGGEWRQTGETLDRVAGELVGIDPGVLGAIRSARAGACRPDRAKTIEIYGTTLEILGSVARVIEGTAGSV